MTHIKDSVFIVTGAASGIGQATAIQAAAEGAHVLASDVNAAGLARTEAVIKQAGGTVETALLDVGDEAQVLAYARQVAANYPGRRLVLLNNAGVALGAGSFEENTLQEFAWLLNINLWGVVRMTQAFLPLMRAASGGHIANVSSVFGMFGAPESTAYSTAKFGVRGFTECLRHELEGSGIQVSTVFPGGVKTNITVGARLGAGRTAEQQQIVNQKFAEGSPTTPEQAAAVILRGIRRNQVRILIGADARIIDWLTRLLPVAHSRILVPLIQRTFSPKEALALAPPQNRTSISSLSDSIAGA
ncbi:SDR family NAD(P)-dependent oxidoreductase [Hymenobacter terrenus]|uniref:SDR family NAD(P)-dependent oxidoreductase n=1 Tax=Hymenobacter terrenus TaxID=1629124 RepID=UPI0006190811|nr:SDR family NAD(P)-dependent oxidoreductase [Hymenobacter terrenus]